MITKYGDDIVNATKDFAKSDAKEAIELINTYGDDALKMVKSKQSGDLVKKVCEGLKKNNISFDEFQDLKLKDINELRQDEVDILYNIRERIKIDKGTRLKKVFTDADARNFYIDKITSNNEISGFVSRAEDSKYLSHNYKDVVETYRLDYTVKGKRPFPDGGNCHWEMEFNLESSNDISKFKKPYGSKFGGTKEVEYPCTGNAFTGAENGTTIPEWEWGLEERVKIKDGATLNKYVDGKIAEQYIFKSNLGRWIKL